MYFLFYYLFMFYFDTINGKKILKSDLIKNTNAFFTARDLCLKSGDENSVKINKKLLCDYLKIKEENLISPVQTHSANVEIFNKNKKEYLNTDGLILTEKDYGIFLNFADCVPLIFYDEKQNIGAISHAGWRGTAQKISAVTANKLVKECNSNKNDIIVLIGPSICFSCYKIGEDVFEQLKSTVTDFKGLYRKENDEIFVDLKNINKKQLTDTGITKIDVCPYCTCCNNEYFFSYRKENGTTNRHNAVLKLI